MSLKAKLQAALEATMTEHARVSLLTPRDTDRVFAYGEACGVMKGLALALETMNAVLLEDEEREREREKPVRFS